MMGYRGRFMEKDGSFGKRSNRIFRRSQRGSSLIHKNNESEIDEPFSDLNISRSSSEKDISDRSSSSSSTYSNRITSVVNSSRNNSGLLENFIIDDNQEIKNKIDNINKNKFYTRILDWKIEFNNDTDYLRYNVQDDSLIFDNDRSFTDIVEKMMIREEYNTEITDEKINVLIITEENYLAKKISNVLSNKINLKKKKNMEKSIMNLKEFSKILWLPFLLVQLMDIYILPIF